MSMVLSHKHKIRTEDIFGALSYHGSFMDHALLTVPRVARVGEFERPDIARRDRYRCRRAVPRVKGAVMTS